MKVFYKILTIILLLPTIYFLFILGSIQLMEGYNLFNPYIDTEFAENYTPQKFNSINKDFSKEEVINTIGQPLFIWKDSIRNEIEFSYTNDGLLVREKGRKYPINDFAWYRSIIYFDSIGKIIRIEEGWTYD